MEAEYEFVAIDLEKLLNTPCSGYILQLLSLANDIDSLIELGNFRKNVTPGNRSYFSNSWAKGVLTYLNRQNISIVFESLDSTISRIAANVSQIEISKGRVTQKPRLLWNLIREEEVLYTQIQTLESFRLSDSYRVMKSVRDKLGAHADATALKNGLRRVITVDNCALGLHVFGRRVQARSFFLDDLMNQQNLEFFENVNESAAFPNLFNEARTLLVAFAYTLLKLYCSENDLYASGDSVVNYKRQISEVSDFKFLPPINGT